LKNDSKAIFSPKFDHIFAKQLKNSCHLETFKEEKRRDIVLISIRKVVSDKDSQNKRQVDRIEIFVVETADI